MSDFVAEFRPRPRPIEKTYCDMPVPEGFVTELRPRSRPQTQHTDDTDLKLKNKDASPHKINETELLSLLSGQSLSKERMVKVIKGSILTLLERVLTGRLILHIDGQIQIIVANESQPIVVNLGSTNESLLDLESSLHMKVRNLESPPSSEDSSCETDYAVSPSGSPRNFHRDFTDEAFDCGKGTRKNSETISELEDVFSEGSPSTQERLDSDEESGYTSTGKEDSDVAMSECESPISQSIEQRTKSNFRSPCIEKNINGSYEDGLEYLHSSMSSSKSDSDDTEFEEEEEDRIFRPLVIDESQKEGEVESSAVTNKDKEIKCSPVKNNEATCGNDVNLDAETKLDNLHDEILSDENDDPDSDLRSGRIDHGMEVQDDLSGDSEKSLDTVSGSSSDDQICQGKCSNEKEHKHGQGVFACNYCSQTFTAKNNLKRHTRIHTGMRPFKCNQCTQAFARRDDLKCHERRHDYSKPFRCSLCKKGYTDRACVKNHMIKEHRSRLMHVCPKCGESFDKDEAFSAHKSTHPELSQFACSKCSFIGTHQLMTQKHSLIHEHKLFSCKPCNAFFADPFDYTSHMRKHKKSSNFSHYSCCFCDSVLPTYEQFVRHEYSHAQGKIHACKICQKQFKSKSLLQEHTLTHEASSPCNMNANPEVRNVFYNDNKQEKITASDDFLRHSAVSTTPPAEIYPEGELLDLSMKKTPPPEITVEDESGRRATVAEFGSDFALDRQRAASVPRNGCASPRFAGGKSEQILHSSRAHRASGDFESRDLREKTYRPVFSVSDGKPTNGPLNLVWSSTAAGTELPPLNDESRNHIMSSRHPEDTFRPSLHRSKSIGQTQMSAIRFNPYAKGRIADFAAKFIAARGPREISQKLPLRPSVSGNTAEDPVVIHEEMAPPHAVQSYIAYGHNQENRELNFQRDMKNRYQAHWGAVNPNIPMELSYRSGRDTSDMSGKSSVPETVLRSSIPTVVKSEPGLETDTYKDAKDANGSFIMNMKRSPQDSAMSSVSKKVSPGLFSTANTHSSHKSCVFCSMEFGSFSELEAHCIENHKRYLCEHCGKSFTARPNRDRHVRYHTGERPYKCDICDCAFFRGDDLKYHRTTRHPMAQPFVCTVCSATFAWGRDLDRHIRHSKCCAPVPPVMETV